MSLNEILQAVGDVEEYLIRCKIAPIKINPRLFWREQSGKEMNKLLVMRNREAVQTDVKNPKEKHDDSRNRMDKDDKKDECRTRTCVSWR